MSVPCKLGWKLENKPKNKVKIQNEYKTQNFAPAPSNFNETRSTNIYHSAGKHDRGPLFFTKFSFRLIRSRLTGSI